MLRIILLIAVLLNIILWNINPEESVLLFFGARLAIHRHLPEAESFFIRLLVLGKVAVLHTGRIATDSGFADNTFTVTLPLSQFAVDKNSSADLTLQMNVNAWFSNPYLFDFNVFGGSIMQNREAQEVLRENGRDVFSVKKQ